MPKYTLISHNSDDESIWGSNAHFRIRPYAAFRTARIFEYHLHSDKDPCSYIFSHVNATSKKTCLTLASVSRLKSRIYLFLTTDKLINKKGD